MAASRGSPQSIARRGTETADRIVGQSVPGTFGHDGEAVFEMVAGLIEVSPGDAAHGHGRSDDHVRQFGEQVIAATADPLARVTGRASR